METYDQDAVEAAVAPGIAKAKAQFDAVAEEMGGRPVDEVHAELVKRLEAEPFVWDAEGLRKIAASISGASQGPDGDRADEGHERADENAGSEQDRDTEEVNGDPDPQPRSSARPTYQCQEQSPSDQVPGAVVDEGHEGRGSEEGGGTTA